MITGMLPSDMQKRIRMDEIKHHYGQMVNVKSSVGAYIKSAKPMHITKKTELNRKKHLKLQQQRSVQQRPYSAAVRERNDLRKPVEYLDTLTKGKYMDDGEQLLLSAQRLSATGPKTRFVYKESEAPKTGEAKHMQNLLYSADFTEQRELISKLSKIKKGRTDTSEPVWHHRKDALKGNGRTRTDHYLQVEH